MDNIKLKKLGIVKTKILNKDFDNLYEKYKSKAVNEGFLGDLKFITEHGRTFIYVVI